MGIQGEVWAFRSPPITLKMRMKKYRKVTKAYLNRMKRRRILETIEGPDGKILKITSITMGRPFSIKEAVLRRIVSISKEQMLELFTEQELKEMNYNYYE